jgi:hypothetical protein
MLGSFVSVESKGSFYVGMVKEMTFNPKTATLVGFVEDQMAVKITKGKVSLLKKKVTVPLDTYTIVKPNQLKNTGTYMVYKNGTPQLAAILSQKEMFKMAGKKSKFFFDRGMKEYMCVLSDTEYLTGQTLQELQREMLEKKIVMVPVAYPPHYTAILTNLAEGIKSLP